MDRDHFELIFNSESEEHGIFRNLDDDNAIVGLNIIRKYLPKAGITGADHDIIYSVDVDDLVNAGITVEDAKYLWAINWHIDEEEDCLACFV